jgi:hypothetical protein
MCYIDGQKNKYSVSECNAILTTNLATGGRSGPATWMSRGSGTPCRSVKRHSHCQVLLLGQRQQGLAAAAECLPLGREEPRSSNALIEITTHAQLVPLKMIANCGLFCCWQLRGSSVGVAIPFRDGNLTRRSLRTYQF